jgi:hypothetical protein
MNSDRTKEAILSCSDVEIYKQVLNKMLYSFPKNFWKVSNEGYYNYKGAKECTRYLLEEVLQWNRDDICKKYSTMILHKYKLGRICGMFAEENNLNDDNITSYKILDNAYPGEFKPYELQKIGCAWYWSEQHNGLQNAKEVINDFLQQFKEKGNVITDEIIKQINWSKVLHEHNMYGMFEITFKRDYRLFFKELFNIDITDLEALTYDAKIEQNGIVI